MLGQLQDAGNSTTLAHYLDLLSGTGMLAGVQKYAQQKVRQRGSSPKFLVYNTALLSAQVSKSFDEARADHAYWGRLVESAIGAHLLNSIRGTAVELFYWREGDKEVDYILKKGNEIVAIEVKSTAHSTKHSGIERFEKKYRPHRTLLVGSNGLSIETFLLSPLLSFF